MSLTTSKDPVGAPVFYRDVPLMPAPAEESGVIKPLAGNAIAPIDKHMLIEPENVIT